MLVVFLILFSVLLLFTPCGGLRKKEVTKYVAVAAFMQRLFKPPGTLRHECSYRVLVWSVLYRGPYPVFGIARV